MITDIKTLQELEFHTILEEMKSLAFSDYGKAYFNSFKRVNNLQKVFRQVEYVINKLEDISNVFYRVESVEKYLQDALEGKILDQEALKSFFELFTVSKKLSSIISDDEIASEFLENMRPPEFFLNTFVRTFNPDGSIKDSATPQLLKLRKELKSLERQITEKVKSLLFEGVNKGYIAEALILQRHERYVLPVIASKRNMVRGIVHGQSATSSTYYIEPEELIGLNDSLILTKTQETREISKILSFMTKQVVDSSERISLLIENMKAFDALCARARYALENNCVVPTLKSDGTLRIFNGRNPLISKEKVVPIDFEVSSEDKVVVLSGPNTGGKTATLKMVGTFVLMTLMGIPIPAGRGTQISLFDRVFSDIGDDQSIKNELSTFSAKVKRENEICKKADEKTLVLIDEIGDGTEPTEGVAFAKSVIDILLKRNSKVIVTTHLPELKTLALNDSRVRNASVGFDVNRMMPTYKVHMDMPGRSHAFEIIKRIGVCDELIESFKKNREVSFSQTDVLIERLQTSIQEYEKKKEELLRKENKLNELEKEISQKLEKLREKRLEELDEKVRKMSDELSTITKEMEKAIHTLKTSESLEELREENKKMVELKKKIEDLEFLSSDIPSSSDITVGSDVEITGTGVRGVVISVNEEKRKVTIDTGSVQVELDANKVKAIANKKSKEEGTQIKEFFYESNEKPPTEIDIRGMTVEDALPIVEEFSDRVLKFKTIGYIIHGKGTGKLANGVWAFLRSKKIPFRIGKSEEGGTGVTVIGGE